MALYHWRVKQTILFSIVLFLLLMGCAPEPPPLSTPTPTATSRPPQIADNENVEALNAAQAALAEIEFGFAPLLLEEQSRLHLEASPSGPQVRLIYSPQPADPTRWKTVDSFVLAYAIRQQLLQSPQVKQLFLGRINVAAPLARLEDRLDHVAVWVRFLDGSQAIVDFSPLATHFAAQHRAVELINEADQLENLFNERRRGVSLNNLQPMTIVKQDNNVYYLLASVIVHPERYEFSLRVHQVQTATPIRPLLLTRGVMAQLDIPQADLADTQQLLGEAGPTAFNDQPALYQRIGHDDPTLNTILDDHLYLLWHMATKLELPTDEADLPHPPTYTPTATPTATPTPTPPAAPLLVS